MESQFIFNPLPAVVLGGPPHSGKSVLAYSLTLALRQRDVPHYLLRAYPPDYEGDWFLAGDPETVRHLRLKGARSESWLPLLRRDIARRHLPLLVDVGGLPTLEQETLLDECTHGLLLTRDPISHAEWEDRLERHGLVLLADFHSDLGGQNCLAGAEPLLRGTLAGLERGHTATGPAFDALVERLAALFAPFAAHLRRRHLASAPAELTVDLATLASTLGAEPTAWQPGDLPAVLEYLPEGQPLALYGRGPNWLYAAIARHTLPAPFYLFDIRQGWMEAPSLPNAPLPADGPLTVTIRPLADATYLEFHLPEAYLDPGELTPLSYPPCPPGGVILSGKLPHWLWAALVRSAPASWIAVVQPQSTGAVVVASQTPTVPIGMLIPQ